MKIPTTLLPLILTNTLFLHAQEEAPQAGYLNVVNLVTLLEPTRIELGGFQLNGGEAIPAGESSGVLAIQPGSHPFTITNETAKPEKVSGSLVIEHGKTVAVICYDEVKEFRDGSRETKLKYSVLVESDAAEGPRLSLVSLSKEPLLGIEISGAAVTLTSRIAHKASVELDDNVELTHKGRTLSEFEIAKAIHYIGFLFENPESGEVEVSLIQNEKLEYQPPLEADEEEEKEE